MTFDQSMISDLHLQKLLNDLLVILTDKEKKVITKRFALDNRPRQTLEKIGKSFLVTRERVRQIEASALKKLQRNILNTKLNKVNEAAMEILVEHGGILSEKILVSEVLNRIYHTSPIDGQVIKLALTVNSEILKFDSPRLYKNFWYHQDIPKGEIKKIADLANKILTKNKDVMAEKELINSMHKEFKGSVPPTRIISILEVDFRFKKVDNGWGLSKWRHVNPKSIRDKANIILKKAKKPLHFVEIANRISASSFDKKNVTVQAVHNDLIRYPEFVLVGRGLYALKDWGFESGTVADIIAKILKEEGPIAKKEIVKKVLEQRDVKVGTISLNLQKSPAFVRVGRAVYDFDESKWNPEPSGRGRKKVKA
jgi:hypothetical protein